MKLQKYWKVHFNHPLGLHCIANILTQGKALTHRSNMHQWLKYNNWTSDSKMAPSSCCISLGLCALMCMHRNSLLSSGKYWPMTRVPKQRIILTLFAVWRCLFYNHGQWGKCPLDHRGYVLLQYLHWPLGENGSRAKATFTFLQGCMLMFLQNFKKQGGMQ